MTEEEQRERLLYLVARLHYGEEKLTNTEIANRVQVSGTQINRLLKEAENKKIVRIYYTPPRLLSLEERLRAKFDCLKEVFVAPSTADFAINLRTLGSAAAVYFDEQVTSKPHLKVGISGGNTIYAMVMALAERDRQIEVYPTQLIGRGPYIPGHKDPIVLMSHLSDKSGSKSGTAFYYATIPPLEKKKRATKPLQVGNAVRADYETLKEHHPTIRDVWERMHNAEVVFSSLGPLTPDSEHQSSLVELLENIGITKQWLSDEGIVGDISYSLFDESGESKAPRWDFFLTLGIKHFKAMAGDYPRRKVVLVVGENKLATLKAALKGRLGNVLITLESVAEDLLH